MTNREYLRRKPARNTIPPKPQHRGHDLLHPPSAEEMYRTKHGLVCGLYRPDQGLGHGEEGAPTDHPIHDIHPISRQHDWAGSLRWRGIGVRSGPCLRQPLFHVRSQPCYQGLGPWGIPAIRS